MRQRSLNGLIREAKSAATLRGHKIEEMGRDDERGSILFECKHCDAWVQCQTHPAANSRSLGGPAVAVKCKRDPLFS